MKTIGYIIQKEFKQIFRNKGMLPIIFVLPILQLVILANAATFEVKNIKFSYIDNDRTSISRALIEKFNASDYFNVITDFPSEGIANSAMTFGAGSWAQGEGKLSVLISIRRYGRSVL